MCTGAALSGLRELVFARLLILHNPSTDFQKDSVRIRLTMFHDTIVFTPD
jgi:hypothetical protein